MADINNAEDKELYESLFADAGSREIINIDDWKDGWSAIVGGINGIPTSRQFNTLQYITDYKILMLFHTILELKEEIKKLQDQIEGGSSGTVVGKGGFVFVGNISKEINALDILFIVTEDFTDESAATGGLIHVGNAYDPMAAGDVTFILSRETVTKDIEGGQIYVGGKGTAIRPRGVLLIISNEDEVTPVFKQAAFTNFEIGQKAPSTPNWGFVNGKLTVASDPDPDTTFFAQI